MKERKVFIIRDLNGESGLFISDKRPSKGLIPKSDRIKYSFAPFSASSSISEKIVNDIIGLNIKPGYYLEVNVKPMREAR